jgi:integrase
MVVGRPSQVNQFVVPFGTYRITLYQRGDIEESSWYFRIHLKDEDRFYRKSLGTKDKAEAVQKAQDELITLLAKIKAGERILTLSVADLVPKFLAHLNTQAESGELAERTVAAQGYRIKLAHQFLRDKLQARDSTKLTAIDGNVFLQYLEWRLARAKANDRTVRRDVIRDELLVIRKMFTWAKDQGLCHEKNLPNWDFAVEKQGPKRQRITIANFRDFFNTVSAWVKEPNNKVASYHRIMLMHLCVLVSTSGMRSGEVFGLKNRDVEMRGEECVITVRPETSKVRRGRQITLSTQALKHWIARQLHKAPNDFVFSPFHKGTTSARDTFYHAFKALRTRLKEIDLDWFDLYHCRHWYITSQLLAEQPIHLVALAAGTSTGEIESTYSHVLTELTTKRFNQRRVRWLEDGTYEVIETAMYARKKKTAAT